MQLEKYYLDVVSPDGRGCIGYAVRLNGFGLAATIAATARWNNNSAGPLVEQRTLQGDLPRRDGHTLTWQCPALDLDGAWSGWQSEVAEQVLWIDPHHAVHWQPLAPQAAVSLRLGKETIQGWGYAERLSLDLPPWLLPIDALRWGRFVSPEQSVVWIEWQHATPRRWLWHNGVRQELLTVTASGVTWPGWSLDFEAGHTLRSGRLADTVFSRWPAMRRCLPPRIQAYAESKWCAPGMLRGVNGIRTSGSVIHEFVQLQ